MHALVTKKNNFYCYYILFILIPFSQSIPLFSIGGREVNVGMNTLLYSIYYFYKWLSTIEIN